MGIFETFRFVDGYEVHGIFFISHDMRRFDGYIILLDQDEEIDRILYSKVSERVFLSTNLLDKGTKIYLSGVGFAFLHHRNHQEEKEHWLT